MLGAIVGDIVGSVHEFEAPKHTDFPWLEARSTFTDDSVLTVAVAECVMTGAGYVDKFHEYTRKYPRRGYGAGFFAWVQAGSRAPYNSWGNGSAMRVSSVGFAFPTMEETLRKAKASAEVTHNHPEGIKGAQATAMAIFFARQGESKAAIRKAIEDQFAYNLRRSVQDLRPVYRFNESCQETVPEAIIAFLESSNYEEAVRLAISLGGDADTLACIAGGIAEAFYGIPRELAEPAYARLDDHLQEIVAQFYRQHGLSWPLGEFPG
jgi:ADP-ribosylglycohydrolase